MLDLFAPLLQQLLDAIKRGDLATVKTILSSKNQPMLEGDLSLLCEAIAHPTIILELLQAYSSPPEGFSVEEINQAFKLASSLQFYESAAILLANCHQWLDEKTLDSTLFSAIGANDAQLIEIIGDKCSDLLSEQTKSAALLLAIENGFWDALAALLDYSAFLNVFDFNHCRALQKFAYLNERVSANLLNSPVFALFNGYREGNLNEVETRLPGVKFLRYALEDNANELQAMIEKNSDFITNHLLYNALCLSLQNKHSSDFETVRVVLDYFNLKIPRKQELFQLAYTQSNAQVTWIFLDVWSDELDLEVKKSALQQAINHRDLFLLEALLTDSTLAKEGIFLYEQGLHQLKLSASHQEQRIINMMVKALLKVPAVAFIDAAANGQTAILKVTLQKHAPQITSAVIGFAFRLASQHGHASVLQILLEQWADQIHKREKQTAFCHVARNGAIDCLKVLIADPHVAALADYRNNLPLKKAREILATIAAPDPRYGLYQSIINMLIKIPAVLLLELIGTGNYQHFENFLIHFNEELTEAQLGTALGRLVELSEEKMLKLLLTGYSRRISRHHKLQALVIAAKLGHASILKVLLGDPSIYSAAHLEDNKALNEAKKAHKRLLIEPSLRNFTKIPAYWNVITTLSDIPTVYFWDLIATRNAEEMKFSFDIIHAHIPAEEIGYAFVGAATAGNVDLAKLLLLETPKKISPNDKHLALVNAVEENHLATVKFLLTDRGVREIADSNGNEAFRLARTPEMQNLLMQVETVAYQAHLAALQSGSLAQRAQLTENAVTPLSREQQAIGKAVKKHYKSVYQTKGGWQQIFLEIKVYLATEYEKNPAKDEKGINLPLTYSPGLSKEALEAYYQHPIHTAWRYLSSPNLWIDPQAISQSVAGGRAAIIRESQKKLLSYLWLAISDTSPTIKLVSGFTVEGNKYVFAQNLAALGRGHNWDKTRPRLNKNKEPIKDRFNRIEQEHYDDLDPDKPTCDDGIAQRLFEVPYGHPFLIAPETRKLDSEILRHFMVEQLVNPTDDGAKTLIDKLEALPIEKIQIIYQALLDCITLEQDISYLQADPQIKEAITLSSLQIHPFIKLCKCWYGAARIESLDPVLIQGESDFNTSPHPKTYAGYIAVIYHYARNPLAAFSSRLYDYFNEKLKNSSFIPDQAQSQISQDLAAGNPQSDKSGRSFTPAFGNHRESAEEGLIDLMEGVSIADDEANKALTTPTKAAMQMLQPKVR